MERGRKVQPPPWRVPLLRDSFSLWLLSIIKTFCHIICRLFCHHNKQAFNTSSNNRHSHTKAGLMGVLQHKVIYGPGACHVSAVAFVMLCCSVASPVIMHRGLTGNKAAALLWGCRTWLWKSNTILHKRREGVPPNGGFPAMQGASSWIMW